MFLSRAQIFIASIVVNILFPIASILGMMLFGSASLVNAIVAVFLVGNAMLLLYKVSFWEFSLLNLRIILGMSYVFTAIFILQAADRSAFSISVVDVLSILFSVFVFYLNINVLRASIKPAGCLNLSFPLKGGRYIVTDGGDGRISSLVNYHHKAGIHKKGQSNASMRFAVDIAKLNGRGSTVGNLLSKENGSYAIFHEKVYSPCAATVFDVVDGIEDNVPFSRKFPYNVGNRVVLKTGENYIVLGHLAKGSILVGKGEQVTTGQQLALIGNSGLTPRPHLHMQVSKCADGQYWGGEGVPVFFEGKFYPVKNRIITVK